MKSLLTALSVLTIGVTIGNLSNVVNKDLVVKSEKLITQKNNQEKGINIITFKSERQNNKYIDIYINFKNLALINGLVKLEKIDEAKKDVNDNLSQFPINLKGEIIDINLFLKGISIIICENVSHLNDVDNNNNGVIVAGIMKNDKTVDWNGCGNQG